MYYTEEIIDGILCWKDTPNGKWHQFTPEQLTAKLIKLNRDLMLKDEEKGSDRILVDNGEIFDGSRDQFRDCFFDNATDDQIKEWCQENDFSCCFYYNKS